MAVMKSRSGSGECCSSRVPAEAETSLRHTSITQKHIIPFIYLFVHIKCIKYAEVNKQMSLKPGCNVFTSVYHKGAITLRSRIAGKNNN